MRESPEKSHETFARSLEVLKRGMRDTLGNVQAQEERDQGQKFEKGILPGLWATITNLKKTVPLQSAIEHLTDTLNPTPQLHKDFGKTKARTDKIKLLLKRNVHATPEDLSRFHKLIRDKENISFGDVVADTVAQAYEVQDPATHGLLDQLLYMQAVSHTLFPEIKNRRTPGEKLFDLGQSPRGDKTEPKQMRLTRMLQEDFDLLASMQVTNNYYKSGFAQTAPHRPEIMWRMPAAAPDRFMLGKPGRKTNAYMDIPAVKTVAEYLDQMSREVRTEIMKKNPESYTLVQSTHIWELALGVRNMMAGLMFWDDNAESIAELPEVAWENIRFSREVPSSQKILFEENKGPLLLCVDPAPGKAYLASVSLSTLARFEEIEREKGSAEVARSVLNPLQRPFSAPGYIQNNSSLAFFVRKQDGELCMYGDSNQFAREQLGTHYEECKRLVHWALLNLTHAEYVEGEDVVEKEVEIDVGVAPVVPEIIPNNPILRPVPPESISHGDISRVFTGRTAHTRLLPAGWFPGMQAWQKAREASETLDLYAEVFDESGTKPLESIKLELKGDFRLFRESLQELQKKHGEKVRFQTYVSEAAAEE